MIAIEEILRNFITGQTLEVSIIEAQINSKLSDKEKIVLCANILKNISRHSEISLDEILKIIKQIDD